MEFFHKTTSFPFMATRKVWYVLSAVMCVASIVLVFTRGLNLSVDYTGGVVAQAAFPGEAPVDAVLKAMEQEGFHEVQVQNFGSSRDVVIRMPPVATGTSTAELQRRIETVLAGVDPAAEVRSFEVVGPQVGSELLNAGIVSLLVTIALIFIYVVLRFHTWRLSVGAIVAAMHDPLVVLGFFAALGITFDLSVIAALLAVIGYSLNDTVVVFDRIRERFETNRRSAPEAVLDQSINQTLSRTIITSGSTLIVVILLYSFGGPVLQGFSVALIVGILVGTYSSIYVASAVALDAGLKAEHLFPPERKAIDEMP